MALIKGEEKGTSVEGKGVWEMARHVCGRSPGVRGVENIGGSVETWVRSVHQHGSQQ